MAASGTLVSGTADHVSLFVPAVCTISLNPIPAVSLAGHRVFFAVVLYRENKKILHNL
jgi:hypothetical protein